MPMIHQAPELYAVVCNVSFYHTYMEGDPLEKSSRFVTTDVNADNSTEHSEYHVDLIDMARQTGESKPIDAVGAGLERGLIKVHPSQRAVSPDTEEACDLATRVCDEFFDHGNTNTKAPGVIITAMLHHTEQRGWNITRMLTKALQDYQQGRLGQSNESMQVLYRNKGGVVFLGGEPMEVVVTTDTPLKALPDDLRVVLTSPEASDSDTPSHYKWNTLVLEDGSEDFDGGNQ